MSHAAQPIPRLAAPMPGGAHDVAPLTPGQRRLFRREARLTDLALLLSAVCTGLALWEVLRITEALALQHQWVELAWQCAFVVALWLVMAGGWAYLLPRRGYYQRRAAHEQQAHAALTERFREQAPPLVVLVPSYKEELLVVRQTLMSAALQDYPVRSLVLLIDDPHHPDNAEDAKALAEIRTLPRALQARFDGMAEHTAHLLATLMHEPDVEPRHAAWLLAVTLAQAASWLGEEADAQAPAGQAADHTAALLLSAVLRPLQAACEARSAHWLARATEDDAMAGADTDGWLAEARAAAQDLHARFSVAFSSFERKRYANLSHEPNKAMNLNSYLALMGGSYREVPTRDGHGLSLEKAAADEATFHVPDAGFVLTLDADSLLLPDYALRLADVMMRPGNERLAVVQTPYSAVPGAPSLTERIAGGQTDIQYLMHQGFTRHGATFWVGANALLRKTAIEDIATEHEEGGRRVKKYIHDRTVIEDTESSIDLVDKGWQLHNYPERLAYSATPPDFGALLIQRRRWADGGLIILPKALRYLMRSPARLSTLAETFLRVHYLSSVATVNLAFLLLMFGPFSRNMGIVWIPLSMLPYMLAYARDLVHCGYRWQDFPRVYALNLLLLPVNLGGALRSVYQILTGRRAPFARTPKVTGRTAMPGLYVVLEYLLLLVTSGLAVSDAILGHWGQAAISALYAGCLAYGITHFIGWRASVEDLRLWLWPSERKATADIDMSDPQEV